MRNNASFDSAPVNAEPFQRALRRFECYRPCAVHESGIHVELAAVHVNPRVRERAVEQRRADCRRACPEVLDVHGNVVVHGRERQWRAVLFRILAPAARHVDEDGHDGIARAGRGQNDDRPEHEEDERGEHEHEQPEQHAALGAGQRTERTPIFEVRGGANRGSVLA